MNCAHCVWVPCVFAFRNFSKVMINCEWLIYDLVFKFCMVRRDVCMHVWVCLSFSTFSDYNQLCVVDID